MADYTEHYQLHQWQPQDPFLRTDFNEDLQKIDTALDQLKDNDTLLQSSINECGNCKLFVGSYIGTGTKGQEGQSSFQFPSHPLIVLLIDTIDSYKMLMAYGQATGFAETRVAVGNTLAWTGNTLQWHNSSTSAEQLNMKDRVYHVYAWMDAAEK